MTTARSAIPCVAAEQQRVDQQGVLEELVVDAEVQRCRRSVKDPVEVDHGELPLSKSVVLLSRDWK